MPATAAASNLFGTHWPSEEQMAALELHPSLVAVHAEGPAPGVAARVNADLFNMRPETTV